MTRIDFYLSQGKTEAELLQLTCKIVAKAYRLGHRVFIFSDNKDEIKKIDSALWHFQNNSFIAHASEDELASVPVFIGSHLPENYVYDLCVNLSSSLFKDFSRFKRVIEIIDKQEYRVLSGRERYKAYRHKNYPIHQHHLNQTKV